MADTTNTEQEQSTVESLRHAARSYSSVRLLDIYFHLRNEQEHHKNVAGEYLGNVPWTDEGASLLNRARTRLRNATIDLEVIEAELMHRMGA